MSSLPTWAVTDDLQDWYAEARAVGVGPDDVVLASERMTRKFVDTKKNAAAAGTTRILHFVLLYRSYLLKLTVPSLLLLYLII